MDTLLQETVVSVQYRFMIFIFENSTAYWAQKVVIELIMKQYKKKYCNSTISVLIMCFI